MKKKTFYTSLYDKKSKVDPDIVLNTYRKSGSGGRTKHFVTIAGLEIQVYTNKQVSLNRLFADMFGTTAITDQEILETLFNEGTGSSTKHFVIKNGIKMQVFTAAQISQNRLFLNGEQITDLDILNTHFTKGNRQHFVTINGIDVQVLTANKLAQDKKRNRPPLIMDAIVMPSEQLDNSGDTDVETIQQETTENQALKITSPGKERELTTTANQPSSVRSPQIMDAIVIFSREKRKAPENDALEVEERELTNIPSHPIQGSAEPTVASTDVNDIQLAKQQRLLSHPNSQTFFYIPTQRPNSVTYEPHNATTTLFPPAPSNQKSHALLTPTEQYKNLEQYFIELPNPEYLLNSDNEFTISRTFGNELKRQIYKVFKQQAGIVSVHFKNDGYECVFNRETYTQWWQQEIGSKSQVSRFGN